MKLLFFSSMKGHAWGGSEELWAAAAGEALAAGHHVAVCVFAWPGAHRPKLDRLIASGATLIERPLKRRRLARLRPPSWLRRIEAFAPDAVCLSQGGAYEAAGRKSVFPLLWWLDSTGIPFVNVIQFNREHADLRPATASRARRLFDRAALNAFVAQRNIHQAERHLDYTAPLPRAVVVRNPVNLTDTSPLPPIPRSPDAEARFAAVARLDAATKGHDLLIEALSADPWPSRPWSLSLFGQGPDESRFREMVQRLNLQSRIHFRGQVSDIRSVWSEHDLLILPSREEGTPLAMVEAMVLARPCLVTDVGGCAEWVREGHEGWLAPTATVADIAAALERAWSARAHWPFLGAHARERALALWDHRPGLTLLNMLTSAVTAAPTPAQR